MNYINKKFRNRKINVKKDIIQVCSFALQPSPWPVTVHNDDAFTPHNIKDTI